MTTHRQWLDYEMQADTYGDGLTGSVEDDAETQEANRERADLCFRGSYEMPGPVVPAQRKHMTVQEEERCRSWLRKKINKLRG